MDPQIVVGLLVDRSGFPLEVSCFDGATLETHTILPVIKAFCARHGIKHSTMVIAADAGMLSATNLKELDAAGLSFIVGSRMTKAPNDLQSHFHWNGDAFTDGQIIDTVTPRHSRSKVNNLKLRAEPVWDPAEHPKAWRAVWAILGQTCPPRHRDPGRPRSTREGGDRRQQTPSNPPRFVRPSKAMTAPSMRPAWPVPTSWSV